MRTEQPHVRDSTADEPSEAVGRGWTARLMLLHFGLYLALLPSAQILLAEHMAEVAPVSKEAALGWATGFGALVAVVTNPVAGALSDRTTTRIGRRRPWIAGGAAVGALGLALTAAQSTVTGVTVGWCLAQVGLNAQLAAAVAAVPDRVPVRQRASVSGSVAIPQALGLVIGAALITTVVTGTAGGYLLLGGLAMVCALPFLLLPEPPSRPVVRARPRLRDFWVSPRAHPDYGWAWATRFLVNVGNSLGTLYLLYYLKDAVGHTDPERGVLILTGLYTAGLAATSFAAGVVSDRLGRRRPLVAAGALMMSLSALLMASTHTWTTAMGAATLVGMGLGIYIATEQALLTEVLPQSADRGKDLGLLNAANTIPQVLSPVLGAFVVTGADGYTALYLISAGTGALGAALVWRIRSVR
ncbi:MFS transporter [Streptomyces clavuligerus]|nr:MFS transporter [Streptomyces clavuligerus]ANW17546.1 MFS transporter [Streptomyces clavuligerus]AXU12091.1 MFS transporter [Streptomyces clavuligerus]MBY6301955.1 MFS transporter [Streptomyces clavuligerus]QCS04872.1 MFS transporter [Streptomyces clavuligerus]QPJ95755.1 MFS transporter [Streptomyces clavuligerus]